jgi:hypothetical protein
MSIQFANDELDVKAQTLDILKIPLFTRAMLDNKRNSDLELINATSCRTKEFQEDKNNLFCFYLALLLQ